jgi:translocation and assembly module TamB
MRRVVIISLATLAVVAGLLVGPLLRAQDQTAKGLVESMLQDVLSSDGRGVVVDNVEIALSGDVTAERIEVKDSGGTWLVMQGFSLDWQPLSLLSDSLEIDALEVARIDLLRLPVSGEDNVDAPDEVSSLTNANISALKIGAFKVSAALAGSDVVFTVNGKGKVRAEPAEVSFNFRAERSDGAEGSLVSGIILDPVSRKLNATVVLAEPSAGLAVNLLGIRGTPSVDLRLGANGTLDNWSAQFELDLDGEKTLTGAAGMTAANEERRLVLNASGDMSRLVPEQVGQLFGGAAELTASARIDNDYTWAVLESFQLANTALKLRASGPVDFKGTNTDLRVSLLAARDDSPLTLVTARDGAGPVLVSGLTSVLAISGALDAPDWTLDAKISQLRSDSAVLNDSLVNLKGKGLDPSRQPVLMDGSVVAVLADGVKNKLPPAVLGALKLAFAAQLDDRSRLTFSKARGNVGAFSGDLSGHVETVSGEFDLNLEVTTTSPKTGTASLDALLAGDLSVAGRAVRDAAGVIRLDGTALDAPAVRANVNGRIEPSHLDLSVETVLRDLSRLHKDLAGSVMLSGTLQGPRNAPRAKLSGEGSGITMLGRAFDKPKLAVDVVLDTERPSGDLALTGMMNDALVSLRAALVTDADGTRRLRDVSAVAGTAKLTGSLVLPLSGAPTGAFTLSAPDLTDISPFVLQELSGSMNGQFTLTDRDGLTHLHAVLDGRDVRSEVLSAALVSGDVEVDDLLGKPKVGGHFSLKDVEAGGLSFSSLSAVANKNGGDVFDLLIKADGRDLTLDSMVTVAFVDKDTRIDVKRLKGAARGVSFAARDPFSVEHTASGQTTLSAATFAIGGGEASFAGRVQPDLDLDVAIRDLPLGAFEQLAGQPGLAGILSGQIRLSGKPGNLAGSYQLKGQDMSVAALREQGIAELSADVSGKFSGQTISVSGTLASGSLVSSAIDGSVTLGEPHRLDLRFVGRGNSAAFADRLARQGVRFDGNTEFNIRVHGRTDNLQIEGSLRVVDATLGDADGRFVVRNASGVVLFTPQAIRIENLRGVTGSKGTAQLNGSIGLAEGLPANLNVRVVDGRYTDGTLVNTGFDAALTVTGPLADGPLVAGEIRLKKAKITLSEIPPSALQPLEVRHVRAPQRVRRQAQWLASRSGGGGGNIRLDIVVIAKDPITISGRGLNVSLDGKIGLTGLISAPVAQGAFKLRRGSMKLLARRLEFERGRLDFFNDLDPRINLVAVSRSTDATINLVISGRASAPEITVTSSPDMPQQEALAQLIFDRSMVQLSPLQIAQLAAALATLSGGGGDGVFDGLQNSLGVDWVEITQTPSGETAVGVGKRINDRLSVGVEQTTETNTSRVIIDLRVSRSLKLRGAAGTDGTSRAGVYFEKDY